MSFIEDIQKVKTDHLFTTILSFVSIISPGVLILFMYKPELIYQFDIFKILLLSLSITMPLLTLNFFALASMSYYGEMDQPRYIKGAMLFTAIIFNYLLLIAYLRGPFTFKQFVLNIIFNEIGLLAISWFICKRKNKSSDTQKQESTKPASTH